MVLAVGKGRQGNRNALVEQRLRIGGLQSQYHRGFMRGATQETGNWMVDFMNSYNWSIAGGSDEIQRNIIAERLLCMPREPKTWQLPEERA